MNETILSPRQKAILTFLVEKSGVSRSEISKYLYSLYPVSKPTVIRDLNHLLALEYIEARGKGRSLVYELKQKHDLLKFTDLDTYFLKEPDQRVGAKTTFNFDIFDHFHDLFSLQEKKALEESYKNIDHQLSHLDQSIARKELERFMIELSWKSSHIEGNTYSLLETETLLVQQKEAQGHTRAEATMILNHKEAFEAILKTKTGFTALSLSKIEQLHAVLTKDLSITKGFRTHAVGISGTVYRPPDNQWQIREAIEKLATLINTTPYPLEKALITLVMISYIQPFADGNKRTARMLTNALLLAHSYYPLSYRSVEEEYYKKTLILFYEQNNLSHFKQLFLDQYKFALNNYFQ